MSETLTVERDGGETLTVEAGDTLREGGDDLLEPVGDTFHVMAIEEDAVVIKWHDGRGQEAVDREEFEELLEAGAVTKMKG